MMYILDTCAVSETIKALPDENFVAWLRQQKQEQLFITAFSLGELRKGIDRLDAGVKKHQLLLWLARLAEEYQERVLDFDSGSAMTWGSLCAESEKTGRPLPLMDSLIAATTLRHGGTLVTRNEKDYYNTGVLLLNPWSQQGV